MKKIKDTFMFSYGQEVFYFPKNWNEDGSAGFINKGVIGGRVGVYEHQTKGLWYEIGGEMICYTDIYEDMGDAVQALLISMNSPLAKKFEFEKLRATGSLCLFEP